MPTGQTDSAQNGTVVSDAQLRIETNDDPLCKFQNLLLILLAFSLPLSLAASETFYGLAFATWIAAIILKKNRPLHYTKLEISCAVMVAAFVAAILFSPSPRQSVRILGKLVKFGLIFLVANNLNTDTDRRRLTNAWLAGAIIASAWTVVEYLRGVYRPGGFLGPMQFGHIAMMFTALSIPLCGLKNHKRTSILAISTLAVGTCALVLTLTRGAWAGLAVGVVLFFLIKRRWISLLTFAVATVLTVLLLSVYWPNSQLGIGIRSLLRPFDRTVPRTTLSNLQRWYMWKAAWEMFKQHPLLGIGPYRFEEELPDYLSQEIREDIFENNSSSHAHSIYFDCLATTGIIGFGGVLFFFLTVFRLLISRYETSSSVLDKSLVLGVLIAFTCACVGGATHQYFHRSATLLNLVFMLGLVL